LISFTVVIFGLVLAINITEVEALIAPIEPPSPERICIELGQQCEDRGGFGCCGALGIVRPSVQGCLDGWRIQTYCKYRDFFSFDCICYLNRTTVLDEEPCEFGCEVKDGQAVCAPAPPVPQQPLVEKQRICELLNRQCNDRNIAVDGCGGVVVATCLQDEFRLFSECKIVGIGMAEECVCDIAKAGYEKCEHGCKDGKCLSDPSAPPVDQPVDPPQRDPVGEGRVIILRDPLGGRTFKELVGALIDFIFWVGIVVAPVILIIAGFWFMTALGDPKRIQTAKKIILYTFIGLALILMARGLIAVLRAILGA